MFEYMLESDPNDNCSQEMADEIREDYLFANEEFMAVDYKALAESYEEEQKEYDMLHGNDDSDDNL